MLHFTKFFSYFIIYLFTVFYPVKATSQQICNKLQIQNTYLDHSLFKSSIINLAKTIEKEKIVQLAFVFIDIDYKMSDNIIIKNISKIIIDFFKYKSMILIENNKLLSSIDLKKQIQPPD